ncbi:MAG: UDP-N-acetylglucosamine 2-epimerase (non-hydrolyzing) [Deltaproteobacteria bacterium]|nr:UDP-N-acetylglucosamine 2-epimerase (non-hydrolyzing) [Deltaproteobacteria bacterium]
MGYYKIVFIAGARPNFMKIAPIVKALERRRQGGEGRGGNLQVRIVHTGQHYDANMSGIFFRELGIPRPDYNLNVGSGSHAEQTAKVMVAFEKVLLKDRPDLVVVVGDVNSTIACSLTAKKLGVPVAHVEAGLRSFDMGMPEEINRILTDRISDLLFVTEESGIRNLKNEGVPDDRVHFVGNVMIDTLLENLQRIDTGDWQPSEGIRELVDSFEDYAVLTLHRPSNVDRKETFAPVWRVISDVGRRIPIIFPVHPRTRAKMEEFGLSVENVRTIEPIGYMDMLWAVRGAKMVLTDSGGLQEETTVLGVPCVTIRENTERPSTIEIGTNYLAGTDPEKILSIANEILGGEEQSRVQRPESRGEEQSKVQSPEGKKGRIPPLWDGKAAERIVEILIKV